MRARPQQTEAQVQLLQANTRVQLLSVLDNNKQWALASNQGVNGWVYLPTFKVSCDLTSLPSVKNNTNLGGLDSLASFQTFDLAVDEPAQQVCPGLPAGGMLVQAPKERKISFAVDGISVRMDGTILIRIQPGKAMTITILAGSLDVSDGKLSQHALTGQELQVPLGGDSGLVAGSLQGQQSSSASATGVNMAVLCQLAEAAGITIPCQMPQSACTFTVESFAADKNPVQLAVNVSGAPSCSPTTLRWSVSGVESVALNGRTVAKTGSLNVCINKTTTYTLTMACGGQTRNQSYTLNFEAINK
jgi:hypothetical protein